MILSIDPGVHHHGLALWDKGELLSAWLQVDDDLGRIPSPIATSVSTVVVEIPQIYPISRSKGGLKGQNDLVNLAYHAGLFVGKLGVPFVQKYKPHEWKGSVPKDIMGDRILGLLSHDEHQRIIWPRARKTKGHNVVDGIGIGLKYLRRL